MELLRMGNFDVDEVIFFWLFRSSWRIIHRKKIVKN